MKITKTQLQNHWQEVEREKAEAFKRARKEIERQGITDNYMLAEMAGKKIGGKHYNPFVVENGDSVWWMIENGFSTDEITDFIYNNKK